MEARLKLPWFKFSPDRWLSDEKLRTCTIAARGLWIDMLSLMHKNDRRGYLQVNGQPVSAEQLSRIAGISPDDVRLHLRELQTAGVTSASDDGLLYSRAMVRDTEFRAKCGEAGAKGGGNPTFKGSPKGQRKRKHKPTSYISDLDSSEPRKGDRGKPPDPLWDSLCAAFNLAPVTPAERTRYGRIVSELRQKGVEPAEIAPQLRRYREKYPKAGDTPEAVLKHWDQLKPRNAPVAALLANRAQAVGLDVVLPKLSLCIAERKTGTKNREAFDGWLARLSDADRKSDAVKQVSEEYRRAEKEAA